MSFVIPQSTDEVNKIIKGFDYSEIEPILNELDFFSLDDERSQQLVKLLRLFVTRLIKNMKLKGNYSLPIYLALQSIQDDFTFCNYTNTLKEGMWV